MPARYDGSMATNKFTFIPVMVALLLSAAPTCSADDTRKADERLRDSADLFNEIMSAPDKSIPQDLINKASCVVLIPGLKKGALIIGAKYGKGYAVCRAPEQGWGPPAAIRIEGGSAGFQAGFSSSDVVLLIMNERGMKHLMQSKFTIGTDATAAVGPVGRDVTAQTDAMMRAEILSWSRSHGLFAGVSVDGATLRGDVDENETLYGKRWTTKEIVDSGATPPAAAKPLIDALTRFSMRKTH
jgi:lipid-binding SYLF domain-containing protein